jgi:Domain of unknown function (DUF2017)
MSRFTVRDGNVTIDLPAEERSLLSQVLHLLAEVGEDENDPGHRRLNIPMYLDDAGPNRRLEGWLESELESSRRHDRRVYQRVVAADAPVVVDESDANAFLRVLNEGRLAFAARLGIEVAADHASVPDMERAALDYMGWVLEDLTVALMDDL